MTGAAIKPKRSKVGPKRGKRIMDPERRAEFKAQRSAEERERIEAAVLELTTTEGWQRWVRVRSRFHNYSPYNCYLIALQRPDATHVASYNAWQSMNRHVMRGQKAIRILAPILVKDDENDGRRKVVGFKSVSVFDLAQTDGEDLPELDLAPVEGDDLAPIMPKLRAFAEELGYRVEMGELPGGTGGFCRPCDRVICLATGQSVNATVSTLVHELAHALGVGYREYGREAAEVIVETAAMIVCGSVGLDTSGWSVPYIASWSGGDPAAIRTYAEKIDELAKRLETAAGVRA